MSDADFYSVAGAMDTTGGDSTRTENFIEILQQLDPLPELPENGEDRFFSKEALDFQYATGPSDNPPFPTWGAPSAEVSAMAAAAAASAAANAAAAAAEAAAEAAETTATAAEEAAATPVGPASSASPAAYTPASCGMKRSLAASQQVAAHHGGGRGAVAADRCVFLRQRLGGESVSSGNSSTSTSSSDNGSASDDLGTSGEWGGAAVSNGAAEGGGTGGRDAPFAQGPTAFPTAAAAGVSAPTAAVDRGSGSSVPSGKAARRKRHAGPKAKERYRNHVKRGNRAGSGSGDGGSARGGSVAGHGAAGVGYASWDTLRKPFKQQWDHVDSPAARLSLGAATASRSASPLAIGSVCSVFSAGPRPSDTTAFCVEQCSAQAHPTAVASYVLRVRCAGGAHIVRRTWDDIVSLCTMLGRDLALPANNGKRGQDTARSVSGGGVGEVAAAPEESNGVEFAPADVVSPDAASGFLKELLARPGMAWATPVRRFLELEYLDGTFRRGASDNNRVNAAREMASIVAAASTAASCSAPAVETRADFQPSGTMTSTTETAERAQALGAVTAPATGLRSGMLSRTSVAVPGVLAMRLPAHPDAARDLAAVCRCLGEQLGAAAFTGLPPRMAGGGAGAAAYWASPSRDDRGGNGGRVAPQRGSVAVLV